MGRDLLLLGFGAVRGHRLRSSLSMLGIAIGITAVLLLTSIGEGTRRYIVDQFSQFGTNVVAINPGKIKTMGVPGVLGGSTRKLTIDDALSLLRIPSVTRVVPMAMGQARVEAQGRGRSVYVFGVTSSLPEVLKIDTHYGTFLPPGDPRRANSVAVLGSTLKKELFGDESPLGSLVRVGGVRFRVIGVMKPKGRVLGFDIDDCVYIDVTSAMRLFNLDELKEIDVGFQNARDSERVAAEVTRVLRERHGDNEDFTVITQTAMLETFDNIMNIVTLSVGAIAGISLIVGAIGIVTMMWISVRERTSEIGLIRSLGGTSGQVRFLFLAEAVILAGAGGTVGLLVGLGLAALIRAAVPGLPIYTPPETILGAMAMSLITGLVSGVLPANRAAGLDPIEALRSE